ncbi:MAG: nitronate monooxygenase [Coriobacteriaceae bacterium]|nr:nitronate monooxygenase [Coriobacteriaceae bacterium]
MRTRITELLGIEHPIFQGAMAWIADASLASAVSNAGGLGILAGGSASADVMARQIDEAKARTDKPFALNIMLMSPHADDLAQLAIDKGVQAVTTGAGSPAAYMASWKDAGIKVIPVVASTALARRMEKCGADAVIAEGGESGGHIGELNTMALVPQVVQAVRIPVLAAGGIASGRQLAAALLLGAEGVQVGTRFLTVDECTVHENYKRKVLKAKDSDTIVTGRIAGHPVRGLKNKFAREARSAELKEALDGAEQELRHAGSLRRAAIDGDLETGSFMAGEVAGMVHERGSAAEVVQGLMAEAETILNWSAEQLLTHNETRKNL